MVNAVDLVMMIENRKPSYLTIPSIALYIVITGVRGCDPDGGAETNLSPDSLR